MDIDSYMAECGTQRFVWGTFDCCLFAAGAIEVTTGVHPMKDVTPYKDATSAGISLRESFNTNSVRDVFLQIAERYNARKVDLNEARNGDVVCIKFPTNTVNPRYIDQSCGLGVFYRNKVYGCLQSGGIIHVPLMHRVIDIWRFEKCPQSFPSS